MLTNDLPILDLDHVRETFGVIDANTIELLGYFVETTLPLLDEIDAAMAGGRHDDARAAAHATAGAARTAGATAFARPCSDLETAIVAGDLAAAANHHRDLMAEFPRVVAAIEKLGGS